MAETPIEETPGLSMTEVILTIPEKCHNDDDPSTFNDDDALLSIYSGFPAITDRNDGIQPSGKGRSVATKTTASASHTDDMKSSEVRHNPHTNCLLAASDLYFPKTRTNKIGSDVAKLRMIGREGETAILKSCLDRLERDNSSTRSNMDPEGISGCKELVAIRGSSGSGKTTLVHSLKQHVMGRCNGVFVEGKCEMNTSDKPYHGIAQALGKLCSRALNLSNSEQIASDMKLQLGNEAELLVDLVPELQFLLPDYGVAAETAWDGAEHELSRLKYAFRAITRILNSQMSPIVIFLDDLQWADISTLQVSVFNLGSIGLNMTHSRTSIPRYWSMLFLIWKISIQ